MILMVFMIGMNWSLNGLLWRNVQHGVDFFCANRSFVVRVVVNCSFVIIRFNVPVLCGFWFRHPVHLVWFWSLWRRSVLHPMASNPSSSFRQDSTKRHVFRLDTIYLNHSSYQFGLAILTALLLASHQSPTPSSIWLLFSNVILDSNILFTVYDCLYTL